MNEEIECKTHPDAPHGFVRNASHTENRYVCECEYWEEPEVNEQIRLLAEQARKHYPGTELSGEYWVFDEQLFAKLIIKECVDIVSGTAVDTPPNDLFYGYNLGVNKAAENIKERFRIEE